MDDNESSLNSAGNDFSSECSMEEVDEASERSVELGMDYPRIEFSQEEYDRICGNARRVKRKPLAKKKKVKECLSDSQSSQASEKPRRRKTIKKKPAKVTEKKKGVARKRKIVKKVVRRRSVKKEGVNYEEAATTDDESEYEAESEVDSDDSDQGPSSPVKKKKRDSSPKAGSSRSLSEKKVDKKKEKEERRIEEIRRLMEQKWRRKEERKEEEKKERDEKEKDKQKKREKEERKRKEERKKEKEEKMKEKEAEAKREKAKSEGKSSKDRVREEEKAEEERRKRKEEKRRMKKLRRQMEERAMKKLEKEEKQTKELLDSLTKIKSDVAVKKEPKETSDSSQEVPPKHPADNRPAMPGPSLLSVLGQPQVLGQPKSILKKPGASRVIPTGPTATPAKVVVNGDGMPVDRPRFDDTFRVPRKSAEARVDEPKKPSSAVTTTTAAPVEPSETSADDDGWNPKDDARTPPPRIFKKTPVHDLIQKPGEAVRPQGGLVRLDRPDPRAAGANATPLGRPQLFHSSSFATPVKTPPVTSRETSLNMNARQGFALVKRAAVERKEAPPPTTPASPWKPTPLPPQQQGQQQMQRQPQSPMSPSSSSEREGGRMRSASRWDQCTPPPAGAGGRSPVANTPQSPPLTASPTQSQQSTPSFPSFHQHLSTLLGGAPLTPASPVLIPTEQRRAGGPLTPASPVHIPTEQRGPAVRWRFIPIDDDCLPPWRKHTRIVPSPASPVQRCRALIVAGPFDASINKAAFEAMMKSRGADVEWVTAPPTDDVVAQAQRSLAAIIFYDEATAKALLGTQTMKVDRVTVSFGEPKEVLAVACGFLPGEVVDETKLIMEMTDAMETNYGCLVELLVLSPVVTAQGEVHCKARFFHEYHATRAGNAAPLPIGKTGRTIAISACPPDRRTTWVVEVASEAEEQARAAAAVQQPPMPGPVPPPAGVSMAPMGQPGPAQEPSVPPVSFSLVKREISATAVNIPLVWERSDSEASISTHHGRTENRAAGGGGGAASRFSALPAVPIAPPGLIDHDELRRILNKVKEEVRSAIPHVPYVPHIPRVPYVPTPVPVPAPVSSSSSSSSSSRRALLPTPPIPACIPTSLIPLPPGGGPIPILPYPEIPQVDHQFFRAPVKVERGASGGERGAGAGWSGGGASTGGPALLTVDPATFIRPFGALLPHQEEDEVLLFASLIGASLPAHWDAVRKHFKDLSPECKAEVYGGILTMRFKGAKAKEKAQLLLLNSPHTINGEQFAIGMTYPVVLESSNAVGKTRLYEEIMLKFGSVVEVEKQRDSVTTGKPVYKIYFAELKSAQAMAEEGITVGDIALTSIGPVPE